jgi:RNase P subunit RPR2
MAPTAVLQAPVAHAVPVIDPRSLTLAQLSGRRCAVPNCRRLLTSPAHQVGRLPDGRPVLACPECAPEVRYELAEARRAEAA